MKLISRLAPPAAIAALAAAALTIAAAPAHAESCEGKIGWYTQQAAEGLADGGYFAWDKFDFWMKKAYIAAATSCGSAA